MISSTRTRRAGRVFMATALVAVFSTTGCSKIMGWADQVGDYMPTYNNQRCEDRNFCWKSEQTTTATPAQMRERRAANKSGHPVTGAPPAQPMMLHSEQVQMQQPMMSPQPMPEPAMMGGMPAPRALPRNEEEAKRWADEGKLYGGGGAIPAEVAPPGMPQEMLAAPGQAPVQGLKSYEQDPPWRNDNPPVPVIEEMKEGIGW